MKQRIVLLISLVGIGVSLPAQSFEERFRSFRQEAQNNYASFRDKANQQYADFMRAAWEYYKAAPAVPIPQEEPVPPVIYNEEQQEKEEQVVIEDVVTPPTPQPQPEPQPLPIEPVPPISPVQPHTCQFKYFNTPCTVRIPKQLMQLEMASNDAFAQGWEVLSNGEYDATLSDCLQLRTQLSLCDWAYLLMLYEFSTAIYKAPTNEAILLCAWLYTQSGYQMRLAQDKEQLHLLFASSHAIYGQPYFQLDGYNYYSLLSASDSIQICTAAFENEQTLSLYLPDYPHLQANLSSTRTLQSSEFKDMFVTVQTNRNLIEFYNTYPSSEIHNNPLTRWAMYANTPLSTEVEQNIYPLLYQKIQGLTYRIAVEKLLNFVQTAFVYEYDDKVWGDDRAFFAEETLFYPYADCEDRSILFSRLVRDLLGLPVVLVYYPGHLATAVAFPEPEQGDYILIDGKRFTICDPTYIGAPVGATMPNMNNQAAKAILL